MTKRQAELINIMCLHTGINSYYVTAYKELLGSCSDALVQPTVTVSTTGTSAPQPTANTGTFPPPPSTPKPLGPEWWKERQAEALREQTQIIADQNKTIEALKKRIAEDKEHAIIKAGIDNGCRESNKEIIDALTEHGLYQAGLGGIAKNVKNVVLMCVERGKRCDDQKAEIKGLYEKIAELRRNITASVCASSQILESLNRTGLRQHHGSLADNVVSVIDQCAAQEKKIEEFRKVVRDRNGEIEKLKGRIDVMARAAHTRQQFDETDRLLMEKKDKEIESLKKQIEARLQFTQQDREIIEKRNTEIAELRAQVARICKENDKQGATIRVLNDHLNRSHKQTNNVGKELGQEIRETERLKKELEVAGKKRKAIVEAGNRLRDTLREIRSYNKLLMGEELLSDQAIALWEDNTTP